VAAAATASRVAQGLPVAAPRVDPHGHSHDMHPGEVLLPGQSLRSPDGRYTMLLQASDGNLLVLDPNGQADWASNAYGFTPAYCVMQRDGNLVVYDTQMAQRWASGTHGHHDATLRLTNDGVLTISTAQGTVWQSRSPVGPDVAPPAVVTVRNASPSVVVARFFTPNDPNMAIPIPGAELTLSTGASSTWTMPAGMPQAKLTFNGRRETARQVVGGETVVFSEDQRVRIHNPTAQPVNALVFNAEAWIPGGVPLPGGSFAVAANADAFYEVPWDVNSVRVVLNGRQAEVALRGSTVTYVAADYIRVRNEATSAYEFLIYKPGDTSFILLLPPGMFTLGPSGDERHFQVPADVAGSVKVRIRRPARFPDLFPPIMHTVQVTLGDTVVLRGDLGVETRS